MKKLLTLAVALAMVLSLTAVVASAEDFVVSPGTAGAPEVVDSGKDSGYTIAVTAYKDRGTMTDEAAKSALEAAYGELTGAADVNDLVEQNLREGVEGDIAVGEVFDASIVSGRTDLGSYTFKLRSASFASENFVGLIHRVNGAWKLEENVSVKGDVATITVPEFSPFAIVVNANYNTSPVTSDITAKIAVSGAACFALIGVGFLALSKSKKEEN